MYKRFLGLIGVVLFGTFGMLSGVARAHQDVIPEDMISEDTLSEDWVMEVMTSEDMYPAYTEIRCREPASNACVAACAEISAYCSHYILHPKRVEGGIGSLYRCKGGSRPTYTCSYRFANSDTCHFVKPIGPTFCGYDGGK